MELEEKVLSSQTIYQGRIVNLEQERVLTPAGKETHREIIRHAPAIALLMITADQRMILVKQWRAPVEKVTLEIPAGKVDERDDGDLRHAALREMNEETRLRARHLEKIATTLSSPGFTDEAITLFKAEGLTKVAQPLPQDDDENIRLVKVSLPEALQLIKSGEITDMKTVLAIYYWASKKGINND